MSHIAIYCGWYDASVSGPFALPKVEFMPGAFAYHLSFLQRQHPAQHNRELVRSSAGQGRDLHHGLRV